MQPSLKAPPSLSDVGARRKAIMAPGRRPREWSIFKRGIKNRFTALTLRSRRGDANDRAAIAQGASPFAFSGPRHGFLRSCVSGVGPAERGQRLRDSCGGHRGRPHSRAIPSARAIGPLFLWRGDRGGGDAGHRRRSLGSPLYTVALPAAFLPFAFHRAAYWLKIRERVDALNLEAVSAPPQRRSRPCGRPAWSRARRFRRRPFEPRPGAGSRTRQDQDRQELRRPDLPRPEDRKSDALDRRHGAASRPALRRGGNRARVALVGGRSPPMRRGKIALELTQGKLPQTRLC